MADGAVARRYARALVELGREANEIDRLGADLDAFAGVLDTGDGLLRAALENPGISTMERRGVLASVLERLPLHAYTKNFLRLLMDNGRFGALPAIGAAYQTMADELAGRVRASVTSARALDEAGAEQVRNALSAATGKVVAVDFQVDPALIGGIVARVGDVVYDASVRARLSAMQQALADGSLELAGPTAEA